jgi:hypothetical protein
MKRLLVLAATFMLFSAGARASFFPRFEKEIPVKLCGEFGLLGVITDGIPKVFGGVPQPYAMIETKRAVLVSGEVIIVETVIKVEKKGKTFYLVAFKSSSLSWIVTAGDTLSVVQSDEKDKSRSKIFLLKRIETPLPEGKATTGP